MNAGIYCIENIINKKIYIGQSKNVEKRLKEHKTLLRTNKHHNSHLQHSYNKYGEENFSFCILEKTDDLESLNELENKWIAHYKSFVGMNGYNISYPNSVLRLNRYTWRKCRNCGARYGILAVEWWTDRFLLEGFCSRSCQLEFKKIKQRKWGKIKRNGKLTADKGKNIYIRKCGYCGAIIKTSIKRQKFCSTKCRNAYWGKIYKEKFDLNKRLEKIEKKIKIKPCLNISLGIMQGKRRLL
ncbi:MAG: GIY-YIG nuclease family protein [Candidatus Hodarchaeales archaeon]